MLDQLNQTMETASVALARMDYPACEQGCLTALAEARELEAWDYFARILMPLQECRRQRRMIAAEGTVRLGTSQLGESFDMLPSQLQSGCVVVTRPGDAAVAARWQQQAREQRRHVEVLLVTDHSDADRWTLRSFDGPAVTCTIAAPDRAWREQWWTADQAAANTDERLWHPQPSRTPADWFIDATEALGDAAIAQVSDGLPAAERLAALEARLAVVTDHELLHQHLCRAAHELAQRH